jgi:hypothetical protein
MTATVLPELETAIWDWSEEATMSAITRPSRAQLLSAILRDASVKGVHCAPRGRGSTVPAPAGCRGEARRRWGKAAPGAAHPLRQGEGAFPPGVGGHHAATPGDARARLGTRVDLLALLPRRRPRADARSLGRASVQELHRRDRGHRSASCDNGRPDQGLTDAEGPT